MATGDKKTVVMQADRAIPNGVATLDESGVLDSLQWPDIGELGAAPASHASQHSASGTDPITPDMIGAVNKAGDTMTGSLKINAASPSVMVENTTDGSASLLEQTDNTLVLQNRNVSGSIANLRQLLLRNTGKTADSSYALLLQEIIDGVSSVYTFLHTGNKPSGSYTGNGSGELRMIPIGGIGNGIVIVSEKGLALLTGGAICVVITSSDVSYLPSTSVGFDGNQLGLATSHETLNANGVTYYYQVL